MKKILYAKYNRTRDLKFQISTRIVQDMNKRWVEKSALTPEAREHIESYKRKYIQNSQIYKNILPLKGEIKGDKIVFSFINGYSAKTLLDQKKGDIDALCQEIQNILNDVFAYNDANKCDYVQTDDFLKVFGVSIDFPCEAVKQSDIDIIFDNIIYNADQWYSIDYEWTFDFPIPVEFIKYRVLYRYYYNEYAYFERKMSELDFLKRFGLDQYKCELYAKCELAFQYYVYGKNCQYVYIDRYKKHSTNFMGLEKQYGNLEKALATKDEQLVIKQQEIDARDVEIQKQQKKIQELQNEIQEEINKIKSLDYELNKYKGSYNQIINSVTWKATKPVRLALNVPGCIREHGWKYTMNYMFTGKSLITQNQVNDMPVFAYDEAELEKQRKYKFGKPLVFSLLVPLYNTPEDFLRDMIESVIDQTYCNWELCLADGSDEEHKRVARVCAEYQKKDVRIKYRRLKENGGISVNTNACIDMATGDYIGLFDHDDLLHKSVLYECMRCIEKEEADYIYTDEMTFLGSLDNVINVHYKSDYAPDTLRSYNYICHFSAFSKELLDQAGGFDKEMDGSQDYDLILRLTEKANKIVHIPKVLYFWRAHEHSVAQDISAKPYTLVAAKKALTNHLQRVGLEGEVVDAALPSVYKINYKIFGQPKVSILIPNKDHIDELETCITSVIERSTYRNIEIIIIENNSEEDQTFQYYDNLQKQYDNLKVVYWEGEFNYAAINNFGFQHASGDYILLLNNDVEVITENWIEEMLMFAQRKDVGAVGAMLYYPDNTIQHAGVILGIGGVAGHSHKYFRRGEYGYASRLALVQNLSAVTAACMLMKRGVYETVGGLDPSFKVAFNDVDLCMRIREKGYLNVFTPYAELYHYESKSRGLEDTEEKKLRFKGEVERFMDRWGKELEAGDPYYNPNLSLVYEDFSFK